MSEGATQVDFHHIEVLRLEWECFEPQQHMSSNTHPIFLYWAIEVVTRVKVEMFPTLNPHCDPILMH
jgi:hypothetical protein